MTTEHSDFLSALTFALTERGWAPENVVDIKVNLLTGHGLPTASSPTSASPDDLRIATRSHLGEISANLSARGPYLTAAGGVTAALAAIDAAHAWLRSAKPRNPTVHRVGAAGSSRVDLEPGTQPADTARSAHSTAPTAGAGYATAWSSSRDKLDLAQAPDFADSILSTADKSEAPAAVIVAVALAADDTLDRA